MPPSGHKIGTILLGLALGASGLLLTGCGSLQSTPTAAPSTVGPTGPTTQTGPTGPASTAIPVSAGDAAHTTAPAAERVWVTPAGPPPVGPPPVRPVGGYDNGGTYSIVPVDPAHADYQAATVNPAGKIVFWSSHPGTSGGAWQEIGQSTFLTSADPSLPDATVTGALLPGMSDATFIVHGAFSEDGGVNAVSFTSSNTVRDRWGVIKALPGGDLAGSGQGVGPTRTGLELGLENDIYFVNGQLETAECSSTLPMAACGGDQRVLKYWKWTGQVFALDHTAGLRT